MANTNIYNSLFRFWDSSNIPPLLSFSLLLCFLSTSMISLSTFHTLSSSFALCFLVLVLCFLRYSERRTSVSSFFSVEAANPRWFKRTFLFPVASGFRIQTVLFSKRRSQWLKHHKEKKILIFNSVGANYSNMTLFPYIITQGRWMEYQNGTSTNASFNNA